MAVHDPHAHSMIHVQGRKRHLRSQYPLKIFIEDLHLVFLAVVCYVTFVTLFFFSTVQVLYIKSQVLPMSGIINNSNNQSFLSTHCLSLI